MQRLVAAAVILVLCVSNAPLALASDVGYELKVKGMVCAFCAYSVSRQLRSADGVVPDSIEVELQSGTITLRSEKPLREARLRELVEAAGFSLEAVTETTLDAPAPARSSEREVPIRLTLDADRLADGEFDALLRALGALASEHSASLAVAGPAGLEMRVLQPVLMGHTPAMDVDFSEEVRPDDTIAIEVLFD